MELAAREMTEADRPIWTEMRAALWPDETRESHAANILVSLGDPDCRGFIAETAAGEPAGFAEISIRKFANGREIAPVPFLEGVWIAPRFRRQGAAAHLITHIEAFALVRGFTETGSGALLDKRISHAVHAPWGFSETERAVYFRKALRGPRNPLSSDSSPSYETLLLAQVAKRK